MEVILEFCMRQLSDAGSKNCQVDTQNLCFPTGSHQGEQQSTVTYMSIQTWLLLEIKWFI